MVTIKDKIYNVDYFIADIKEFPQTYETMLKDYTSDGTCQVILRRKLNNLVKDGIICRTVIPGTRHGKVLFYTFPKRYHIVVESARVGVNILVFFEYAKLNQRYIQLTTYWELNSTQWIEHNKERVVSEEEVVLWL